MAKSYKSINEQINLLVERGLIVDNHNFAKQLLGNVSYYRLSSYRFPIFNKSTNSYLKGSSIKDLKRFYERDTQYKALLYYVLQFIEVAFRTQIIYHFSKNDPYFYIKEDNYTFKGKDGEERKKKFLEKIQKDINNTKNIHIGFYQEKHNEEINSNILQNNCNYRKNNCSLPYNNCSCTPESGVALESFDFGQLIQIYAKLKKDKFQLEKNNIAHHDKIMDRYSYKDSASIRFLVKYYQKDTGVLELLTNKISKYRTTFLPYFLVIKYFLDVMFSNNFLSEFEETDFVGTFLSISKSNFYKALLSLKELDDNIFDPYINLV